MVTFTKPASDFVELPVVLEHIHAAGAMVARNRCADFIDEMRYRLYSNNGAFEEGSLEFDSPLEVLFWVWWRATMRVQPFFKEKVALQRHVFVTAQGEVYNLDFVIAPRGKAIQTLWPLVAVELDGHGFHEKTREQVTYRNQRDRALQQAGWRVFHFSWDEFTADPERVLYEVIAYVQATYWENHRAEAAAQKQEAAPVGDDAP